MKTTGYTILTLLLLCLFPLLARSQSTMEFQTGTTIEVQTGADICADCIIMNGTCMGGGTKCTAALPVELASLNALVTKRSVTMTWNTASETDCFGFEVQRKKFSGNAPQWEEISFVKAAGTSSSPHTYSYTDNGLNTGRYAYRLKQIDNGGNFKYFESPEVDVLAPKEFSLKQNFPNPFNPTTTISFMLPSQGIVTLKVYNILGQEVQTLVNREDMDQGLQEIGFNGNSFASGVYFYRLTVEITDDAGAIHLYNDVRKMLLMK